MTLNDHVSVGVPNIAQARQFYDAVLNAVGAQCLAANDALAAYGRERPEFVIILPADGGTPSGGNGAHFAFAAPDKEAVGAFHAAALANGGSDEGAPGPRPGYPKEGVFAAFVRDPFGNKLEAIHNGFAG